MDAICLRQVSELQATQSPELHNQSGTRFLAGVRCHHSMAHAEASLPCPNASEPDTCHGTDQSLSALQHSPI